jgi:hypothetical protein
MLLRLILILCVNDALAWSYLMMSGRGGSSSQQSCSKNVLKQHLKLNTEEHTRECAGGLLLWPTSAKVCEATVKTVATLQHKVHIDSLISPGNAPFKTCSLVHVTEAPVLSAESCRLIIDEAESAASKNGWRSRYTLQKNCDEMHVSDLPGASRLLTEALPLLARTAVQCLLPPPFAASDMRVHNALIVRYDAEKRRNYMPAHGDFSLLTMNIALNSDYDGGGTWFQALGGDGGQVVSAGGTGNAILHAGSLWHAGAATTTGLRYILVIFFHSAGYVDHSTRLQTRATARLQAGILRLY